MAVSLQNNYFSPIFSPHLRAESIHCGLRDKVWGVAGESEERHWRAVLLTTGEGAIETGEEIIALKAPCLAWVPWRPDRCLRIKAGGVGYHFSAGNEVLIDAVGNNPESADLRILVDRRVIATMEEGSEMIADAEHAFDLIVRELHRQRNGSWNMAMAQVRSILVFLWRLSGIEDVAIQTRGESSRILQRFRQLLEMHFRDRWGVADYAEALGISHDRLHDICRRELDRSPLQLIHERVLHEARLRLERSALTVEQVANSLGFRDVSHFSRFFKAKSGFPPAKYRETITNSVRDGTEIPGNSYADWP